jgi:hypothetical protein
MNDPLPLDVLARLSEDAVSGYLLSQPTIRPNRGDYE